MRQFLLGILIPPALLFAGAGGSQSTQPETVQVDIAPHVVRSIGGVTEFNRDQFITVHESYGSTDLSAEDLYYMEEVLDARYGRDGGFISWQAEEVRADKRDPDMPDARHLIQKAKEYRSSLKGRRRSNSPNMREVVLCTHPELMHAMPGNNYAPWGPRTYEGVAEFSAQLLKHYFSDEARPRYLEVFNEPFVKAKKIGATVEAMSEQHNVVAKRVRELNPDVLVGGYAAAWVEVEDRNFEHWNSWQKTFMDIAGEQMDFWSYHIYDGVNVMGAPRDRTGSNSEAIMDLIDTYSHIKFGVAKPILITEYGKIPTGNMNSLPYSSERSAGMLYSMNGQHMTFMDHPDRILKAIPFVLGKAEWTYGMTNDWVPGTANPFLLWRKTAEGDFVTTDLTLFYEFWKGVQGQWRATRSNNPDVRVHCLADDNRLFVILANLEHEEKQVNLGFTHQKDMAAKSVRLRVLTTHDDYPLVGERSMDRIPDSITLLPGMGAMLIIDLEKPAIASSVIKEYRVYATDYLKDVVANKAVTFTFRDTPTGSGTATLRISPGRELGKNVLPDSVMLNGHDLEIPNNWAGSDQAGRKNFFGMIEVPVPMEWVQRSNEVRITYPDTGGKIACAVLQVNCNERL